MTKVRAPLTFSLAITTIVGLIGWEEAARLTGRATRTVRHWSESDLKGSPTLDQAIALDRAFLEAGGGFAPILESYARQLAVTLSDAMACRLGLANDIEAASRESAEAIGSSIHVMQPGASLTDIHRAIAETEEASTYMARLLGRLKSFLHSNVAGQDHRGEQK
jgi:hypothetical protein